MMPNQIDDAYFSIDINPAAIQDAWAAECDQWNIVARSELHLTIGFVGRIERDLLGTVWSRLISTCPIPKGPLDVVGIGALGMVNGAPASGVAAIQGEPRVVFWLVENTPELTLLRRTLENVLSEAGRPLQGAFAPHITLGSFSANGALFDDHLSVRQLWEGRSIQAGVRRFHVTSAAAAPASFWYYDGA